MRVTVKPELIEWARERAGLELEDLTARFRKLPEWESGDTRPTLKQVEAFAKAVHVPVGFLFLAEPPEEALPISDFRTFDGQGVRHPSPDLLDTIYACQERQSWYRDFIRTSGLSAPDFVGSIKANTRSEVAAARMRGDLNFDLAARRKCRTPSKAFRLLVDRAEDAGILVMVSGIVGSNTRRKLDPDEFRSFALADTQAPVVFINNTDTKAAQIFTLIHELAHVWLGISALSNVGDIPRSRLDGQEAWCSAVAAEFLVPLTDLKAELRDEMPLESVSRLAQTFKVSKLVILRRLLDAKRLDRKSFDAAWDMETKPLQMATLRQIERKPAIGQEETERSQVTSRDFQGGSGKSGTFYPSTLTRVSRRFARALVVSTLEGQTLYRDAFHMLGISNTRTLDKLGRESGPFE